MHLGSLYTFYSTIWLAMDPAHNPTPLSRLETNDGVLQLHKTVMTVSTAEARQAAEAQVRALAARARQMQQLAAQFSQLSQSTEFAPSSEALASTPAPVPASALGGNAGALQRRSRYMLPLPHQPLNQ